MALIGLASGANYGAPTVVVFDNPAEVKPCGAHCTTGYSAQIAFVSGDHVAEGTAACHGSLYAGKEPRYFSFRPGEAPKAVALLRSVADPRWFEREHLPCLELPIGKLTEFQRRTYLVRPDSTRLVQVKMEDLWNEVLPFLTKPPAEYVDGFSWHSPAEYQGDVSFTKTYSLIEADNVAGWDIVWRGTSSDPLDSWYQGRGSGTGRWIAVRYNLEQAHPGYRARLLAKLVVNKGA